ncbi:hypothetical protein ABN09_03860 [Morganella morganii]|nr:hypothetical protein ABN09_03860 [Morganella morganii]
MAVGLEQNRLAILLAVLHRHGGLQMSDQDVFVNVVGGVKVTETSADLALLLSLVSSFRDRPIPRDVVIFGEVGTGGGDPSGTERPGADLGSGQTRFSNGRLCRMPTARKIRRRVCRCSG